MASSVGVRCSVGAMSGESAGAGGSSSQAGEVGDATAMEGVTSGAAGASIVTASLSRLTTEGAESSCGDIGVGSAVVVGSRVVGHVVGTRAGGAADVG